MSHVLAVSYGGGHAALVAPVVAELRRRGHRVTLLGLTTAYSYFRERGLDCLGFRDLAPLLQPDVIRLGEELACGLAPGAAVAREETVAYLGLCYRDLIDVCGEEEARARYASRGRQAFLPVATMSRVLELYQPDLVFATNSPRAEQASILAAAACRLPAVCAVDLFALQEYQWMAAPGYADRICVLNDAVRHFLHQKGRPLQDVVVTGNPAFDTLNNPEVVAKGRQIRQQRNWGRKAVTVLWASQPEPERHPFHSVKGDPLLPRRIEAELRNLVRSDDGFRLVVRYHPSEQLEFVEQDRVFFSPASEPLHPLLHAVDVTVTMTSTVGLEAHLIGKPVVTVDSSVFTADMPYSAMGISLGVPSPEELSALILQLELGKKKNTFPQDDLLPMERSATDNVVAVIEEEL